MDNYNSPYYTSSQGSENELPGANSADIRIIPDEVWQAHLRLDEHAETAAQELTLMGKEWQNLYIRWQGPDADSANDFVDNYLTPAIEGLFGSDKAKTLDDLGPGKGALIKLSAGVNMAAHNYAAAEFQVAKMMGEFANSLIMPAPGGGAPAGGAIVQGPLTETL